VFLNFFRVNNDLFRRYGVKKTFVEACRQIVKKQTRSACILRTSTAGCLKRFPKGA